MEPTAEQRAKAVGPLIGPNGPFTITRDSQGRLYFPKAIPTLAEYYATYFPQHATKTFIVFQKERYTYEQVYQISTNLGIYLRETYGIKKGKHVAVAMRNYPEWIFSVIAITMNGGVAVPLNGWWGSKELEFGLKDSQTSLLICDEERYSLSLSSLKSYDIPCILVRSSTFKAGPSYVVAAEAGKGEKKGKHSTVLYEEALREGWRLRERVEPIDWKNANDTDDVAFLMYTSGSTGNPKGVLLDHRGVMNQIEIVRAVAAVEINLCQVLGLPPPSPPPYQPCTIVPVPLFHVTASHHIFLNSFVDGKKIVLMYKWDTAEALRLIETERATAWTGVPTMAQDLMVHPNFAKTDCSSLAVVGGGGAPTPPSQVPRIISKFNGAVPTNGYGLTETNGAIAWNRGPAYMRKPRSCGGPFPIVDVKCVDPQTGKDVGRNARGELWIKSSLVMKGYWNRPEATRESLTEDLWFKSGDIAEIDDEGFIYIVDRAKDIIIRGGENISCAEVEGAFFTHPAVKECAAFAVPHPRLGEVVGLMVMLIPGSDVTTQQLLDHVQGTLAKFKTPEEKHVFYSTEPLPRGATGKTNKKEIREGVRAMLEQTRSKL